MGSGLKPKPDPAEAAPGRLWLGYGLALGGAAFFAVGGVLAKSAFELGLPPSVLAEWRVLFGFMAFLLIVGLGRPRELRVRRTDLGVFAAFGVFGMGGVQWVYYEAIQRIPIAVALVIEYTAVLLILLYARLRGRRVGGRLWWAAALTLAGCWFASGAYDAGLRAANTEGVLLAALDAVLYAGYFLMAERLARAYSAWTLALYGFGFALLVWAVAHPLWTLPWTSTSGPVWLLILGVVVVATVVPFSLVLAAVRLIPAARVSLTATAEPFVAAVAAWAILRESLEPLQLLGGTLVLIGIGIGQSLRPTATSV